MVLPDEQRSRFLRLAETLVKKIVACSKARLSEWRVVRVGYFKLAQLKDHP
jgi:hypothetical protein